VHKTELNNWVVSFVETSTLSGSGNGPSFPGALPPAINFHAFSVKNNAFSVKNNAFSVKK
jgi:hypothetical protein